MVHWGYKSAICGQGTITRQMYFLPNWTGRSSPSYKATQKAAHTSPSVKVFSCTKPKNVFLIKGAGTSLQFLTPSLPKLKLPDLVPITPQAVAIFLGSQLWRSYASVSFSKPSSGPSSGSTAQQEIKKRVQGYFTSPQVKVHWHWLLISPNDFSFVQIIKRVSYSIKKDLFAQAQINEN